MELPISLEQRVTLLEQEISVLLIEVWQLDLSLKKILAVQTQFLASRGLDFQQFFEPGLVAEAVLLRCDQEEQFYEHQIAGQPIVGPINIGWDRSIDGNNVPPGWTLLQQKDHPLQPLLAESLQRLAKRLPELGSLAADMYFNPLYWQHSYSPGPCYEVVMRILTACLIEFSPPDICDRLAARFKQILAHPFETDEVRLKQTWGICCAPHLHLVPDLEDCLELLLALPPIPGNLDLIEQLVLGEMNFGPFNPSRYFGRMTFAPSNFPLYVSDYESEKSFWQWHFDPFVYSRHFNSCKSIWAYQIYGHRFYNYSPPSLGEYFPRLMERLFEHGCFSYAVFFQSVQHLPVILSPASDRYISDDVLSFHNQVSPAFSQVILEYCDRLGWETAQNSKDNYNILTQIKGLRGSRYLLQAVRQHSVHQLGIVYPHQPREYDYSSRKQQIKIRDGLAAAVIHLAQATDTQPESVEERLALVAELKTFPASSLKYLLPIAKHSQYILGEALGWQEALPLIQVIAGIAHRINTSNAGTTDVEVMEVAAFRSALAQSGDALTHEVWTLWREARVVGNNTVLLIEAIAGWNRAEIEKSLPKRKQLAIKAYGLLPLEREDEVLERYLFLKQFALESKKFGSQRQASEQAAVQTALIYLAQTAGYRDTTRLEWAMEARLTQEIAPASRSWSIGDYQIELLLSRAEIQLSVRQGNKLLKSVPATVRQSETYVEIKKTINQLRSQVARYRSSFEEIMATGQPLSCDDLSSFSRMPIAQALLNQLVLATDDSTFGLFAPDAMAHARPGGIAVQALDGTLIPVTGQVYIAHPYHFHKGELAAWQQEIVRQRLVQPFKQVFRELYLLTPAEQETLTYSNRFAGQTLDSRVVAKLFQSRGWTITNGDYPVPCKVFPELGIKAGFEFSDVGHYISETDVITSGRIYFQLEQCQLLPLVEVPPLIFSEIMRDADLVVSVAQREGEARLSEESYQRRGDLIKVLLEDLGLSGVITERHFAYVQGKLARYRVHLGSAVIHIEPGHYLCIVPERWGQRHDRLFLPFGDQGDSKISEVISKVLLLANDDKIKDKSILRQIQTL